MADEMVTIATFGNPLEAEAMKNYLAAEGIPAYVTGGEAGGLFAGMDGAFGLVRLLVAESNRDKALAILDGIADEDADDEPAAAETGIQAPAWQRTPTDAPSRAAGDPRIRKVEKRVAPPKAAARPETTTDVTDDDDEEEREVVWGREDYAARACKVAVVASILVPFMAFCMFFLAVPVGLYIYSLWLVSQALTPEGTLSGAGRLKIAVALVLDVGFFSLALLIAGNVLGGR